jgi:4-amino-4-deoxy-L-arabinose transferase-like glycosyltransferase
MKLWARLRGDRFVSALTLITAVGFLGRLVYVLWMRRREVGGDGPYYHLASIYLVEGHAFVNPLVRLTSGVDIPNALHPPAWTLVLAGPSALGFRSYLAHQLTGVVVGTATIAMTGLAGRAAFGRRAGLIAAVIVACYPNVWIYEREVEAETLAILVTATIIWLAYRFHARPTAGFAVGLGVAVGVGAMTRPELLALLLLLVLPLMVGAARVDRRHKAVWLVASCAACIAVILPWAIYNQTRFARPVPLTTSFGSAMLQGNCESTYHGARLGYFRLGCATLQRGVSDDPSIADGQERRKAIDFMKDNKSRVPVVVAARVGRTFSVFRPFQQMQFDRDRNTELWVIRAGFFMYWALLALAVAGIVVARRRRVPVYPLLAFPATVLLSVLLTIGQTRYRAPAEVPLVLLASVAVDAMWSRWRRRTVSETAVGTSSQPAPVAASTATQ